MYAWVIGKAIPTKKNNMYGSFEFEQAAMLARYGIKVVYIGLDFRPMNHLRKWGMSQLKNTYFAAYEYSLPIRPFPFIQRKVELFFCRQLYHKVEEIHGLPDLIHVHFPAILNAPIHEEYQKRGVRIVATEHWSDVQTKALSKQYLTNLLWFVYHADAMLCVSKLLKKSILELADTSIKIRIVPNIIDQEFKYKSKARQKMFTFIGIGRLVHGKRFDLTINAFAKAFGDNKKVKLVIVGEGEEHDRLQKQIHNLDMAGRIYLLGVKNRAETAMELQKSDVLVCSSNLETFCVPIIEAWACGKPVITTDTVGVVEYVDRQLGIVVEANNEKQMIVAMKEMYSKYKSFDCGKIANFAIDHFGETTVSRQLIEIYNNVL